MTAFQRGFSNEIANVIHHAYVAGVLQYHPMTIADVTVTMTMTMFSNFNHLAFQYNNKLLSISMYDEDGEFAQLTSIENLLADLFN